MIAYVVVGLVLIGIGGEIGRRICLAAVIHDSLDKVDLPAGTKRKLMKW